MTTWETYQGKCLELLPRLEGRAIDAIVTDPPYGIDFDTDYTRFSKGGKPRGGHEWRPVHGDDEPFDPAPWLGYPKVAMFGANCFSDRLPPGGLLVWVKKRENKLGKFLSDAEVCWVNTGHGVYVMPHEWDGFLMAGEPRRKRHHPTEKPVAVMAWVLSRLGVRPGQTVLDPYMGSGSTGVACLRAGINFIGFEFDERHHETARRRLARVAPHVAAGAPVPVAAWEQMILFPEVGA